MSTVEPSADFHSRGDSFNENSPRPPIPGEETEVAEGGDCQSPAPSTHYSWSSALKFTKGGSSPVLTPRRSSLAQHQTSIVDTGAPLGFEPEGSCTSACGDGSFLEGGGSRSPPPYLRWARNLHSLLEDSDGVDLFRRYLEQEGRAHADTLDFWFACEGLKKQREPDQINLLIKVIHRRFFLKTQLAIPDDIRKEVNRRIKEGKDLLEGDVFDNVQSEVERLINETTYPNFLKSDMYLQHVQLMQNGELSSGSSSGSSGSSSGGRELAGLGPGSGMLPTLHEDAELVTSCSGGGSTVGTPVVHDPLPLTKDSLMATQKRRAMELRPKPEAYAGMYLQHALYQYHSPQIHPAHPAYSSYNPVSRQDSELQSLSSDARTESDNMSLTDSSVDGMSIGRSRMSRKQYLRQHKQMKESANINRDPYMHHTVIPRTQRIQKEQVHPMKPDEFAAILIEKLEAVRRDQEAQDKLDRKLREGELVGTCDEPCMDTASAPRTLADAIREKLMVEDDSDQAILDQHVSRVWNDLTPSRSPGLVSPRPRSPEGRRRAAVACGTVCGPACTVLPSAKLLPGVGLSQPPVLPCTTNPSHFSGVGGIHSVPHPYQSHSHPSYCPRHPRKEKDVFSTFSSDSGNVHDFTEGSEHKHYMPKSKSMPDYQEAQKQDAYSSMPGYDPRFRQSRDGCRRSSSKKTLTDLTDSGVSVVSDSTPVIPPSSQSKDRVLSWLMESEKSAGPSHSHSEREGCVSKHRLHKSCSGTSATSPVAPRHSRKPATAFSNSRSGSLERAGGTAGAWGGPGPAQPFVADPSMPPLPLPHTATQLEEARRRLLEEEGRAKACRQRYSTTQKASSAHCPVEAPVSGQSTLKKGGRSGRGGPTTPGEGSEFTTVVFSFCDEQVPYRTKIPGRPVTLRQFKEYLPKKGSYRFFFKTECEDLDVKVIQEEITDDNDILPLWEGKVMAQVKPIE